VEERFELGLDDLQDEVADDVTAGREFDSLADARSFVRTGEAREPAPTTTTTTTEDRPSTTTTTTEAGSTTTAGQATNVPPTTAGP
ncbi:MAG TPA: hypothetical protein VF228_13435, partial [Iamia sp.]